MDIRVSNQQRTELHIISDFQSLIWSPGYAEQGNFELTIEKKYSKFFTDDVILEITGDNTYQGLYQYMEDLNDNSGDLVTIKGHFLTDILSYRVIPKQVEFADQSLKSCIEELLRLTFWDSNPLRYVPIELNFYPDTLQNEVVTHITEAGEFLEILYVFGSVIDFGTNVFLDENGIYHLQIYRGIDRTIENSKRPLIFSKDRDTALQVTYIYDISTDKNVSYIAAEFDRNSYVYEIDKAGKSGLARRELYINSDVWANDNISLAKYKELVESSGRKILAEYIKTDLLECEVADKYVFGRDFNLGDSVTIDSVSLGISMSGKINTIERVWDSQGYTESISIGSQKGLIRYARK